ncbi:MAG: hypothetical protein QOH08_1808 [Chloroflexota bacterium]|nr:hypothetical protein [Chloroflexota bacterium]
MTSRNSLALAVVILIIAAAIGVLYAAESQQPATSVVVAPSASPTTATTTPASATNRPSPAFTSSPTDVALPGADRFAVVVQKGCSPPGTPPFVRREDRNEVIAPLGNGYLCGLNGAVSPDGRRLAYWHFENSGSSEIALYENGASKTLVRLGEEFLENAVWSPDGTGLLFVAKKGGVQGVAPEYAALRTLDLASGAIQELTRVTGRYLAALAWDRARRVTAAAETPASGGPGAYLVITEAKAVTRNEMPANTVLMSASTDATYVVALSQKDFVIRYWPLTAFEDQRTLNAAPGFGAGIAAWRPGTRELAVVVSGGPGVQSLELWSLDGSRRRLTDYTGQGGGLLFRPDGSAVFFGGGAAVDVGTGRVVQFPLAQGERITASLLR